MTTTQKSFRIYVQTICEKYFALFGSIPEIWSDFLDFKMPPQADDLPYYPYIGSKLQIDVGGYLDYANSIGDLYKQLLADASKLEEVKDALRIGHESGFGTSIGLNKYFDSGLGLWKMKPGTKARFHSMLLIIGHDWYPIAWRHKGVNKYFEIPESDYGLFSDNSEDIAKSPYKQSVMHVDPSETLVGMINLIPGYRKEFSSASGIIPGADYHTKAALVKRLAGHLATQFDHFKIVIWGKTASDFLPDSLGFQPFRLYHPGTYRNTMMQSAIDYAYFTHEFKKG